MGIEPGATPEEIALGRIEEAERSASTLLNLSNLGLTSVPEAVGRLANLTELHLPGNRLASVPEAVGRLANLVRLDLDGNRLATLPRSLLRLSKLRALYLHGNRKLGLPPEVLGPRWDEVPNENEPPTDPKAILTYYFKRLRGGRALAEAKVLLVGEGEVGKTSLVRLLVEGETCRPGEPRTEKIAVTPWHETVARGRRKQAVKLNVWDFGGQEIMHATHQFFLSKRSVYLVVLNARESEHQNNLAYWLKVVHSYGKDADGPPPPVLVVLNKSDQGSLSLNETGLRAEYGDHIQFFRVSCRTGDGAEDLRKAIRRAVATLPHVFDESVPAAYFPVKESLEKRPGGRTTWPSTPTAGCAGGTSSRTPTARRPSSGSCTTSAWCSTSATRTARTSWRTRTSSTPSG